METKVASLLGSGILNKPHVRFYTPGEKDGSDEANRM